VIHALLLTTRSGPHGIVDANGQGMVKKLPSDPLEDAVSRPRNTELVIDPHLAQWAFRAMTRILGLIAVGLGVAILLGGEERFGGLSYAVALETPGAPWSWGLWILASGIMVLLGTVVAKPKVIAFGAIAGAMWALLFAGAFTRAAILYGSANTTAPWAYLGFFLLFSLAGGVHIAMDPGPGLRRLYRKV
jgi:hypothetical protein